MPIVPRVVSFCRSIFRSAGCQLSAGIFRLKAEATEQEGGGHRI